MPSDDACPSVDNVVARVDGGLARIRFPGGITSSDQLRAVAAVADRYGNGVVELTNRANVQLRGIVAAAADVATDALVDAGVSIGATGDLRRNIAATPLAGLDPSEIIDVRPLVAASVERLTGDPRLDSLSPKFAVVIDGGGVSSIADRSDDLVLAAVRLGGGGVAFEVRCSGRGDGDGIDPSDVAAVVHVAALASLDRPGGRLIDAPSGWLRDAVAVHAVDPPSRRGGRAPIGAGLGWVGAMPFVGRTNAVELATLAHIADEVGTGEVRLTPWRGVVVPGIDAADADQVQRRIADLGWLTEPDDPATRIVACAGSTGCTSGLTDTQSDARALAARLAQLPGSDPAFSVHLSGCDKRCAQRAPATVTLLGTAPDHYDVIVSDPDEHTIATRVPAEVAIDLAGAREPVA